jgi:hypothetical protein
LGESKILGHESVRWKYEMKGLMTEWEKLYREPVISWSENGNVKVRLRKRETVMDT